MMQRRRVDRLRCHDQADLGRTSTSRGPTVARRHFDSVPSAPPNHAPRPVRGAWRPELLKKQALRSPIADRLERSSSPHPRQREPLPIRTAGQSSRLSPDPTTSPSISFLLRPTSVPSCLRGCILRSPAMSPIARPSRESLGLARAVSRLASQNVRYRFKDGSFYRVVESSRIRGRGRGSRSRWPPD